MESLLTSLALLACPVGMGLMMWFTMRESRQRSRELQQMALRGREAALS